MGGFARRASYWKAYAKSFPGRPALRLDGGSIFSRETAEAHILNRWILAGSHRSGLDAINLTSWDLPVWQEMAELSAAGLLDAELLHLPLVSANVTARKPVFPAIQRYVLRELATGTGGAKTVRVGITGLLFDQDDRISRSDFTVEEPRTAARRVIAEMREKTDYRVVLTDLDLGKAISLAVGVPGISMLVVARNYEELSEVQQVGETLIVIPVNEGRMISEVRLGFDLGSRKVDLQARFVPLDKAVPDDPAMAELIRKAEAEVEAFKKQ